jgi:predicted phosphoribosyltransferase
VFVVDNGLATGSTMRAALASIRRSLPARVLVGVPVAAPDACDRLRGASDACVAVVEPDDFRAVGQWYEDFRPTSDVEVVACLDRAAARIASGAPRGGCRDSSACGQP